MYEIYRRGSRPPLSGKTIHVRPKHRLHPALRDAIARSFFEGLSVRQVARRHGISKITAAQYRPNGLPACACGQPHGHRGWCAVRFALSPARQAVLQRLHQREGRA